MSKFRRNHPLFNVWIMMRRRCRNKRHAAYKNYGGRGIQIAPEWNSFWRFASDMGPRPVGMTLDRIDNDGPYAPWNCRWATRKQQAQNNRNTIWLEYKGERKCKSDWARVLGISSSAFNKRLQRYGIEKAMEL